MRKFFASAFGLSLTASLILGAAFAWSASTSAPFTTTTGTVSIAFDHAAAGPHVVYNGGGWAEVREGNFRNTTPANPGVALQLKSGSITGITTPAHPGCAGLMTGAVNITNGAFVSPGGWTGGWWEAFLKLDGDIWNVCQNQAVDYTVNLVAGT